VLAELLSKWPGKSESADLESLKSRLSTYLTADFSWSTFSNRPFGEFSIQSKELVIGNTAKVLVYDSADSQYPNLAILSRSDEGEWRLKKFLFQCASCFGTGVLLNDPCDTCGATGWGLVDWVKEQTDL